MEALENELKQHIIDYLNLEDISIEDIKTDEPLFGEGLGLDSIDALELVFMLEKQYDLIIGDIEKSKTVFASVKTLAEYVQQEKSQA